MAKPTTTCPGCAVSVAFDPTNGWEALDGSLSHEDGTTHSDSLNPPAEAKTLPDRGRHEDFQPPSAPGSQTPIPPGRSVAEMVSATEEIEVEAEWDAAKEHREGKSGEPDDDDLPGRPEGEPSIFDVDGDVEGKGLNPFVKGGGATADKAGKGSAKIARGEYVSWSGGKGKVDLVVTGGVVPGVAKDSKPVFGSKDGPAARVVKYAKSGSGWKATTEKVAVKAFDLTKIDDLPAPSETKGLEALVALANEQAIPAGLKAASIDAAYHRGLKGWPGAERTVLSREEWALGRARALVDAKVGDPIRGFADADLL